MEYGFHLTATRQTAQSRDDLPSINVLFWSVFWTKLIIGIVVSIGIVAVVYFIPSLRELSYSIFLACLGAFIASFFPIWLLQGLEKFKAQAILNSGWKTINGLYIIFLIRDSSQIPNLLAFCVLTSVAFVSLAHLIGFSGATINILPPSLRLIKEQLRGGANIFFSQVGFLLYANTNVFLLSIFSGPFVVGAYAIAEKVVRAAAMMTAAISQAIFPISARKFSKDPVEGLQFIKKTLLVSSPVILMGCLILFFFSSDIIRLASGTNNPSAALCLRILAFAPFSIFLANTFGSQILLSSGKDKDYLAGTLIAGVLSLLLQSFVLIPTYQAKGASIGLLLSETSIFIFYFLRTYKYFGKLFFSRRNVL